MATSPDKAIVPKPYGEVVRVSQAHTELKAYIVDTARMFCDIVYEGGADGPQQELRHRLQLSTPERKAAVQRLNVRLKNIERRTNMLDESDPELNEMVEKLVKEITSIQKDVDKWPTLNREDIQRLVEDAFELHGTEEKLKPVFSSAMTTLREAESLLSPGVNAKTNPEILRALADIESLRDKEAAQKHTTIDTRLNELYTEKDGISAELQSLDTDEGVQAYLEKDIDVRNLRLNLAALTSGSAVEELRQRLESEKAGLEAGLKRTTEELKTLEASNELEGALEKPRSRLAAASEHAKQVNSEPQPLERDVLLRAAKFNDPVLRSYEGQRPELADQKDSVLKALQEELEDFTAMKGPYGRIVMGHRKEELDKQIYEKLVNEDPVLRELLGTKAVGKGRRDQDIKDAFEQIADLEEQMKSAPGTKSGGKSKQDAKAPAQTPVIDQEKVKARTAELSELAKNHAQLQVDNELIPLKERKAEIEEKINSRKASLADARSKFDASVRAREKELEDGIDSELAEVARRKNAANDALESAQKTVDDIAQEVRTRQARRHEVLDKQVRDLGSRLLELDGSIDDQITKANESIPARQEEIKGVLEKRESEALERLDSHREQLGSELVSIDTQIRERRVELISQLEAKVTKLTGVQAPAARPLNWSARRRVAELTGDLNEALLGIRFEGYFRQNELPVLTQVRLALTGAKTPRNGDVPMLVTLRSIVVRDIAEKQEVMKQNAVSELYRGKLEALEQHVADSMHTLRARLTAGRDYFEAIKARNAGDTERADRLEEANRKRLAALDALQPKVDELLKKLSALKADERTLHAPQSTRSLASNDLDALRQQVYRTFRRAARIQGIELDRDELIRSGSPAEIGQMQRSRSMRIGLHSKVQEALNGLRAATNGTHLARSNGSWSPVAKALRSFSGEIDGFASSGDVMKLYKAFGRVRAKTAEMKKEGATTLVENADRLQRSIDAGRVEITALETGIPRLMLEARALQRHVSEMEKQLDDTRQDIAARRAFGVSAIRAKLNALKSRVDETPDNTLDTLENRVRLAIESPRHRTDVKAFNENVAKLKKAANFLWGTTFDDDRPAAVLHKIEQARKEHARTNTGGLATLINKAVEDERRVIEAVERTDMYMRFEELRVLAVTSRSLSPDKETRKARARFFDRILLEKFLSIAGAYVSPDSMDKRTLDQLRGDLEQRIEAHELFDREVIHTLVDRYNPLLAIRRSKAVKSHRAIHDLSLALRPESRKEDRDLMDPIRG